jgi:hypothetical protein
MWRSLTSYCFLEPALDKSVMATELVDVSCAYHREKGLIKDPGLSAASVFGGPLFRNHSLGMP